MLNVDVCLLCFFSLRVSVVNFWNQFAMLVYSPQITPRITYTLDLVLRQWMGIEFKVTKCQFEFADSLESKFCYADELVAGSLWIQPSGFLESNDVVPLDVSIQGLGADFVCFSQAEGSLPFDVFSAIFYLVSRYEEYLPFTPDEHGRFPSASSMLVKQGIHEIPIVDIWVARLAALLKSVYPHLSIKTKPIHCLVHIDVDNAFAHKGKGIMRTCGKVARSLASLRVKEALEIAATSLGNKQDAFDTYTEISEAASAAGMEQRWYFLLGNLTKFDRPISWRSKLMKRAMEAAASKGEVGIHPSYEAGSNLALLKEEVSRFTTIMGRQPEISRFHYLRFRFPESFRLLVEVGVKHDYSLGYTDRVGYRAGTARPFPFFNLIENRTEPLTLHPSIIMDSALNYQLGLSSEASIQRVSDLFIQQQNTGGEFGVVFHNEILARMSPWCGWESYFYSVLELNEKNHGDTENTEVS